MVERTSSEGFSEFIGKVETIEIDKSSVDGKEKEQYHIFIKPIDKEIKGKTGFIHEWIGISPTATDTSIPEGCILDKYLQQIEILHDEAKKISLHTESIMLLVGKQYLFKKMKHGKAYKGYEAKEYWTPVKILEN